MKKKRSIKHRQAARRYGNTVIAQATLPGSAQATPGHVSLVLAVIVLLATLMVSAVWQKVQVGTLNSQIESMKQELERLREINEKAHAERLNLLSDYRMVQYAKKELHLVQPPIEFIEIDNNWQKQRAKLESLLKNVK